MFYVFYVTICLGLYIRDRSRDIYLWVIAKHMQTQPFIDEDYSIHTYFLPRIYGISIPIIAGLCILCVLGEYSCNWGNPSISADIKSTRIHTLFIYLLLYLNNGILLLFSFALHLFDFAAGFMYKVMNKSKKQKKN